MFLQEEQQTEYETEQRKKTARFYLFRLFFFSRKIHRLSY